MIQRQKEQKFHKKNVFTKKQQNKRTKLNSTKNKANNKVKYVLQKKIKKFGFMNHLIEKQ
jgi:Skp family chaperone for outer membrane proteins